MRHPRLAQSGLAFAAVCAISAVANARPADEVRRSTTLFLRNAHATLAENAYAAGYVPLTKSAGTLDIDLDAHALGLDYDAIFHLHGAAEGDVITWTFDEQPASPWDLGGGYSVSRVRGKLIGRVAWLPGSLTTDCGGHAPCNYSVTIESQAGTAVEISGTQPLWGWFLPFTEPFVRSVGEPQFSLYSGLPMPALASFELAVPKDRFCYGKVERTYSGRVTIDYPSTHGRVWVDLYSNDPHRLNTRRVFIPEGETSARFSARFPADYSGMVVFRAAAGGVMMTTSVDIAACGPMLDRKYLRDPMLEEILGSGDLSRVRINDRGDGVAIVDKKWRAFAAGSSVDIATLIGGSVDWASVDPLGDLIARAENTSGEYVGVRVRDFADDLKGSVVWANAIDPTLGHESGLLVGSCENGPCRWNGSKVFPLPFDAKATPVALTHSAVFLANQPNGNLTRAVWAQGKDFGELGSLGGHTEVVQVNESGDAVGFSDTLSGVRLPVRFRAGSWATAEAIPLPVQAKSGVATGISEDGTIIGNATLGDGSSRAFVLLPGAQAAVFLDTLMSEPGLVVRQAEMITRSGAIVARGELLGKPSTFVVREK